MNVVKSIIYVWLLATTALTVLVWPIQARESKQLSGMPMTVARQLNASCSLLLRCNLSAGSSGCTELNAGGVAGVVYDNQRCRLPTRLFKGGLSPDKTKGVAAYGFLGREYQLEYELNGILPIAKSQMSFLMEHLELGGRLINASYGTDFTVSTVGRNPVRIVQATKGTRFDGRARWLGGSAQDGQLFYMGLGVSHILFWTFVGEALLDLRYRSIPGDAGRTQYRVRIVVSPRTALVNTIMDQQIFRDLLLQKLAGILERLGGSVAGLRSAPAPNAIPPWTNQELIELEQLGQSGLKP